MKMNIWITYQLDGWGEVHFSISRLVTNALVNLLAQKGLVRNGLSINGVLLKTVRLWPHLAVFLSKICIFDITMYWSWLYCDGGEFVTDE